MRCLLLLVLSCLIFNSYYVEGAAIESSDGHNTTFSSKIRQLIENKCLQNANRTTYEEVVEKLDNFVDHWYISLPEKRMFGEELYNYCREESINFTPRLNAFLEKLTPCLDPQEYYLKALILDGSKKHDHYFCKSLSLTGETKVRRRNCIAALEKSSGGYRLDACFKNSKTFSLSSNSNIITKTELCKDLVNINRCHETEFDKYCTDSRGIRDIFLHMPKNALENCYQSM
ncbi:hypothetical protein ILUMI_25177 [Ignelater luminosus]|uniref:Secreted protein n=1 Tax=Ignelater luminosus TaxID=2038154 RepID=A0A8K0C919_IGNLU|nr:hypothetical protein ILUMI_25177 [Ignelater luminosus]